MESGTTIIACAKVIGLKESHATGLFFHSVPSVKAKEIYDALNLKPAPFYRLKAVLPKLQIAFLYGAVNKNVACLQKSSWVKGEKIDPKKT